MIMWSQSMCRGDIAEKLKRRYYDDTMSCSGRHHTEPAYACSGLIIRGVRGVGRELHHAWSLAPHNKKKNSFSVAFLRKDMPFSQFPSGYESGMIIHSHIHCANRTINIKRHN